MDPDLASQAPSTDHPIVLPPRKRQRVYKPPVPLDIPDINEDAAERKRVLNALAQRRYRHKRRKVQTATVSSSDINSQHGRSEGGSQTTDGAIEAAAAEGVRPVITQEPSLSGDDGLAFALETSLLTAASTDPATALNFPSNFSLENIPLYEQEAIQLLYGQNHELQRVTESVAIQPDIASATSSVSADSYLLPMPELTLLRAFLRIATRLGCANTVWDPTATSPFYAYSPHSLLHTACCDTHLPPDWKPTPSQQLVRHHPILDLLPWPSARDRIISIFELPPEERPPGAAGPLALMQLVYDFEDGAEGMRVWGGDPYDAASWEVGQVVFERWWFIFDRNIVEQSNKWRRLRGAAALNMPGR